MLGVGLVLSAGPVRAQDDDDQDDRTFEQKLMDNLMSGLGAKRIEDSGIDYRERSPLVVPSKIALPPAGNRQAKARSELAEGSGREPNARPHAKQPSRSRSAPKTPACR